MRPGIISFFFNQKLVEQGTHNQGSERIHFIVKFCWNMCVSKTEGEEKIKEWLDKLVYSDHLFLSLFLSKHGWLKKWCHVI